MTVYYVDPIGGNDSNNGQSFANRKKWWDDETIGNGDEIRFIKSPDPTSIGNGTWKKDATWKTSTVPAVSEDRKSWGDIDGQASGTPTTVTNAYHYDVGSQSGHNLETGDVVFFNSGIHNYTHDGIFTITKVDDNTLTLDGTENFPDNTSYNHEFYNINPYTVKLESSPIKNIICYQGVDGKGDLDWTIAEGTGGRETSTQVVGYRSGRKFKPGNSVTGKVAHVQLDSALDLSGYQQISFRYFWDYRSTSEDHKPDIFSLRLCSDTNGDTTVHTVPIKPPPGDDQDRWGWYTHDFGSNLNSSIQSVALHVEEQLLHSNTEIHIDNVIACKASSSADSLHLGSLIGKGTTHMSNWYPISAILDKIVLLDTSWPVSSVWYTSSRPHHETSETVTTYKRECYTLPEMYNTDENNSNNTLKIDNEHDITVSGGWNSTDMSTQDTNAGTWIGQHSAMYTGCSFLECHNPTLSDFGFVRGYMGLRTEANTNDYHQNQTITNCQFVNNYYASDNNNRALYSNCKILNCYSTNLASNYGVSEIFKDCLFVNTQISIGNNFAGERLYVGCTFEGVYDDNKYLIHDSGSTSLLKGSRVEFANCTFRRTVLLHGEDWSFAMSFNNCTFGDDFTLFDTEDFDQGYANDEKPNFAFINYNDTANDHRLYYNNVLVTSDSSITQSGSGYSWKYTALTSSDKKERNAEYPLYFKLAEVAVYANAQVTVTAYVRCTSSMSSGTNYAALGALLAYNASVGLTADVKGSRATVAANTWEQITLTFTPTIAGVARIDALLATSGTLPNIYIDSISISQA